MEALPLACPECDAALEVAVRLTLEATDTPCCNTPHLCPGPDPACYPAPCAYAEAVDPGPDRLYPEPRG